jgi:hypothetical protein
MAFTCSLPKVVLTWVTLPCGLHDSLGKVGLVTLGWSPNSVGSLQPVPPQIISFKSTLCSLSTQSISVLLNYIQLVPTELPHLLSVLGIDDKIQALILCNSQQKKKSI